MIPLKDFIESQIMTDESDLSVIRQYFITNNIEEQGMELAHDLAKAKLEKLETTQRVTNMLVTSLQTKCLYENYDFDTASHLHDIQLNFIINDGKVIGPDLLWARRNIPTLKEPEYFLRSCIDWLKAYGINFKQPTLEEEMSASEQKTEDEIER